MLAASLLALPLLLAPAPVAASSPEPEPEPATPIYIFLPEDDLEPELIKLAPRSTCRAPWGPRTGPQTLIHMRVEFTAMMLSQARGTVLPGSSSPR